jgi:putative ABC transport system permease protein
LWSAPALGLQTVTTMGFPTMGRARDVQGGASKLVASRAWSRATRCAAACGGRHSPDGAPEQPTRDIPAPGEAWVDAPCSTCAACA